ncbi:MAG: IPT/TIG domain-containing protein [Sediminibacterium sp.]
MNYILPLLISCFICIPVKTEAQKWPWSQQKPIIDRIEPSSGAPGVTVTITGRNFDSAQLPISKLSPVKFHIIPTPVMAEIVSWNDNRIVIKVPPGKGSVNVTVGESNKYIFTYRKPQIANIYPSSGKVGTDQCIPTTVTVTGKDFGFRQFIGDGTRLMFGQSVVAGDKIKEWNDKKIVFKTIDDCGSGLKDKALLAKLIKYAIKGYGAPTESLDLVNLLIEHKIQEVVISAKRDGLETNVRVITSAGESNRVKFVYPLEAMKEPVKPEGKLTPLWKASAIWSGDFSGPRDSKGRRWFDPDFDDSDWTPITLPDNNSFYSLKPLDRFYRASLNLSNWGTIRLSFLSDDGVWIFLNGRFLGHWGGQWRIGGCVNNPMGRCLENVNVQPIAIPSNLLVSGNNVIAVRVSNGGYDSYFDMGIEKMTAESRKVSQAYPRLMSYYVENYNFADINTNELVSSKAKENLRYIIEEVVPFLPEDKSRDYQLMAWWAYIEGILSKKTGPWGFSNCTDTNFDPNIDCREMWQVGYGVQVWDNINYLKEAFEITHPNQSLEHVGNEVLKMAGQNLKFPINLSIDKIVKNPKNITADKTNAYWASVLMRDPKISAYLEALIVTDWRCYGKNAGKEVPIPKWCGSNTWYFKQKETHSRKMKELINTWNELSAAETTPIPYEDFGACPFECCSYREWFANRDTIIRSDHRKGSTIVFTVKKGEKVIAITGVVITTKPGRAKVLRPVKIGNTQANPGDIVYLLTYTGEGVYKIWHQGNVVANNMDVMQDIEILEKPESIWWVTIRNKRGQTGWSDQPENFDNKDAWV